MKSWSFHASLAFAVLAALAPRSAPAADAPTQVTLPLSEYERLRKGDERPSLTVVDTLRLSGSFRGQGLTVSFAGRSAGKLPAVEVLSAPDDVAVYGCEGDGILARTESGSFALTPLAPRFDVRCRIAGAGSDRLELTSPRGVLHVEAAVADGELVAGGGDGEGARRFSVVRMAAATGEAAPPSATGRYRVTLRPDETRFVWQIEAHNPNRARRPFEVALRSGERVQQVDAQAPYEVVEGRYRFELPPGDTTLTLSGTLEGKGFAPPVEASVQYLLVESDPMLRASVSGAGKRVSPEETGLAARFRGAQAFLLGKGEQVAFTATKLETLRTTSFAVKSARHLLFLPSEGPALGESAFAIDNQGASEIAFPPAPRATYAAFGGEPLLLTKGADGKLTLPLAHGVQQLLLQHQQPFARRLGVATARLETPQTGTAASAAAVEVRYPHEWVPLLESFAGETRVRTPGSRALLGIVLLAFFTERVLWVLGMTGRRRLALASLLGLAALFAPWAAAALLMADLAVTAIVLAALLRRAAFTPRNTVLLVAGGVAVLLVVSAAGLFDGVAKRESPSLSSYSVDEGVRQAPSAAGRLAEQKSKADGPPLPKPATTSQPEPVEPEAYQGLPARVDIPAGETHTFFSREMLPGDAPRPVRLLAISATLAFWLRMLPLALAVWALVTRRDELLAGLRQRLEQARPVPPPVPGL